MVVFCINNVLDWPCWFEMISRYFIYQLVICTHYLTNHSKFGEIYRSHPLPNGCIMRTFMLEMGRWFRNIAAISLQCKSSVKLLAALLERLLHIFTFSSSSFESVLPSGVKFLIFHCLPHQERLWRQYVFQRKTLVVHLQMYSSWFEA